MKDKLPIIARMWAYVAVGYLVANGIDHLILQNVYRGVVQVIMGIGLGVVTFLAFLQTRSE